jgi:hypothetical protein
VVGIVCGAARCGGHVACGMCLVGGRRQRILSDIITLVDKW